MEELIIETDKKKGYQLQIKYLKNNLKSDNCKKIHVFELNNKTIK